MNIIRNCTQQIGSLSKLQRNKAAFTILGLLVVVVVIAILSGWFFREGGSRQEQAASQYQRTMDKSKATACVASRQALRSTILTYTMQNPGKPVTTEALQESGVNLNVCPEGGTVTVGAGGDLLCSIHTSQ